jgi:thioredoxin-related protein
MKKKYSLALLLFISLAVASQDFKSFNLYKPGENANQALQKAVKEAKEKNKHVLVQVGGNWCIWCYRFNDVVTKDKKLDSAMMANYVVYHLNYSPEDKNTELFTKYKFPQRFGFPVFLILNEKGDLLHTQNSWYLEADKTYDKEKTMAFFNDWGKKAFDPANYKED